MQLSLKGDENEDDKQPGDDHVKVYKQKLNSLNKILNDVYPPAESYKTNKKLMKMGRILDLSLRCRLPHDKFI